MALLRFSITLFETYTATFGTTNGKKNNGYLSEFAGRLVTGLWMQISSKARYSR